LAVGKGKIRLMIHTVSLDLTTHCNKRCPDCCCGIGINRRLQHHPWEYFEEAARWLRGINRIHVTGGEPTAHPKFAEFIPKFRELFQCQVLTMNTNGYRVLQHIEVIVSNFDWVNCSDYEDQREAIATLQQRMKVEVKQEGVNGALFFSRAKVGSGRPCSRACWISSGAAYADGKLWGCCVAPGLTDAIGITPTEDWKQTILCAPLPCSTCFLSE
jgi:hypothetical protein